MSVWEKVPYPLWMDIPLDGDPPLDGELLWIKTPLWMETPWMETPRMETPLDGDPLPLDGDPPGTNMGPGSQTGNYIIPLERTLICPHKNYFCPQKCFK